MELRYLQWWPIHCRRPLFSEVCQYLWKTNCVAILLAVGIVYINEAAWAFILMLTDICRNILRIVSGKTNLSSMLCYVNVNAKIKFSFLATCVCVLPLSCSLRTCFSHKYMVRSSSWLPLYHSSITSSYCSINTSHWHTHTNTHTCALLRTIHKIPSGLSWFM